MPSLVSSLPKGSIILLESESKLNLQPSDNASMYGEVYQISTLCENYSVGDFVLFNPAGSARLLNGGDTYFLTTEDKLSLKEE